jgi:hypothetical protein
VQLGGINVAHLLAAFPTGGGKMTSKMEGDEKLAGETAHTFRPLAGIHGAGHVTVRNGKVPSLKLNTNLMSWRTSTILARSRMILARLT